MQTVNKIFTLSELEAVIKKIEEGITLEEFKAAFYAAVENKDSIIQEIDKKYTLADLKKRIYHNSGDKKASLVNEFFEGTIMHFKVTDGLLSYSPYSGGFVGTGRETYNKNAFVEALTVEVEKTTQEMIDAYITDKKAKKEAEIKMFTNPETLEEFKKFILIKGKGSLTPEQLRRYEEIAADQILEDKKKEAEKKAVVSSVSIECEMEIHKTTHTRDGHDLWVVKLSERVEREVYNDLNNKAKKLGGYYSSYSKNGAIPGFTFSDEEAAKKFVALKEGDQKTDKYEKKAEERTENAINKFFEMSQRMQEVGFEEYSRERKENTARRARMAASAQENAERTIYWGKVLNKLGEKLEAQELKYLALINSFSQVIELKDILTDGFNRRTKENNFDSDKRAEERNNHEENLNFVRVPLPEINKENLTRICNSLLNKSGQKRRAEKFLKVIKQSKSEYSIRFSILAIEDLKSLANASNDWAANYVKEEILSFERIARMGLDKIEILKMALREFIPCLEVEALTQEQQEEKEIKKLENQFIGRNIEGFFPTPEELVEEMVAFAGIEEGETILEPSAGLGHIADEIREQFPNNSLHCCEAYSSLREAIQKKGHEVIEHDFLKLSGNYDKIIMNPPFENNQDITHVMHAFNNCLKAGGRIVAIMCEGAFFRGGKTETNFRNWIKEIGATSEQLPEGTFKSSFRPTGVNTRLVIIDKPKASGGSTAQRQLSLF
jgi:phospholipid N-methyltransferase